MHLTTSYLQHHELSGLASFASLQWTCDGITKTGDVRAIARLAVQHNRHPGVECLMPVCGPQRARHGLVVSAGMFDNLSRGLDKAWDMVRKDGKLTADNIKGPMREIRRALLEADVRPIYLQFHGCQVGASGSVYHIPLQSIPWSCQTCCGQMVWAFDGCWPSRVATGGSQSLQL